LAQSEATAFMIGVNLTEAAASGKDPQPIGNTSPAAAPHDCYPCKGEDRWCVIAAENEQQWAALANLIGGAIDQDARFKTAANRLQHRDELNVLIARWTQDKDALEIMDRLQQAGVPCGVVQTGEDLTNDPHLKERGFIVAVENPRLGRVVLPNFPLQFVNAKLTRRWEFPVLGRDTKAVLRDVVGYSEEIIKQLSSDGVLE
jgi:benzylsuccinate CoA-transferase BbsF subunit